MQITAQRDRYIQTRLCIHDKHVMARLTHRCMQDVFDSGVQKLASQDAAWSGLHDQYHSVKQAGCAPSWLRTFSYRKSMTTSKIEKQYPIPAALPAILKGFARETLRAQVYWQHTCYSRLRGKCAARHFAG